MSPRDPAQPSEPDEALLRAFLRGEPAACRRVERWAWEIVYFKPYGIALDEREDVIQQALAGVWGAATGGGFRLRHGLRGLVRSVAMARCVDWLRRRRATVEIDEETPDPRPGPVDLAAVREQIVRVEAALGRLDERCREIIRLHIFEDRGYAEIASLLGHPESTLRVRMFHCLKAVRRMLPATDGTR